MIKDSFSAINSMFLSSPPAIEPFFYIIKSMAEKDGLDINKKDSTGSSTLDKMFIYYCGNSNSKAELFNYIFELADSNFFNKKISEDEYPFEYYAKRCRNLAREEEKEILAKILTKTKDEIIRRIPSDSEDPLLGGTYLLNKLVYNSSGYEDSISILLNKGISFDDKWRDEPIILNIDSPELWDKYINIKGGVQNCLDVARLIMNKDTRKNKELQKHIIDMMEKESPESVNQVLINRYFDGFNKFYDEDHLKSIQGWESIKNEKNQTAMMLDVGRKSKSIKKFWKLKKVQPYLNNVDNENMNIFDYALKDYNLDSDILKWLLKNIQLTLKSDGTGYLFNHLHQKLNNSNEIIENYINEPVLIFGNNEGQSILAKKMDTILYEECVKSHSINGSKDHLTKILKKFFASVDESYPVDIIGNELKASILSFFLTEYKVKTDYELKKSIEFLIHNSEIAFSDFNDQVLNNMDAVWKKRNTDGDANYDFYFSIKTKLEVNELHKELGNNENIIKPKTRL